MAGFAYNMLNTKFRFICPSGFRGDVLYKSFSQKQELPVVAMFVNGTGENRSLQRTFQGCFLPNFGSFGQTVSEQKIYLEINQLETIIACGRHVCKQIGTKLAIFIKSFPLMLIAKLRFICQSGLRYVLRNQPIRNKNCLWRPCLLTDRDKMCNFYRGPSVNASYQVVVHLATWFQMIRFLKSTNQKQELPVAAIIVYESRQNDQVLQNTFQGYFIPSFGSFALVILEKICFISTNQKQELPLADMF